MRLFVEYDDKQVADARAFVAFGVWVSKLVLVESVRVLRAIYRKEHSQIADAIEMALSHQQLFVEDAETIVAALAHYRKRPSLRFSDCVILESARKAGHLPLGTFDQNLSKLGGAQKIQ